MPFPDQSFFDEVYRGRAPWDIGAAQPDLMKLIEEFPPPGRILDLGCGTGDLAIELARAGHRVLGIDFAAAAVEAARSRAAALPVETRDLVRFETADALRPSAFAGTVQSIVDSGFFHLFDADVRRTLVLDLEAALPRGGRYHMLGFAVAIPAPDVPRQVTVEEVERRFASERGWSLRAVRAAGFVATGFPDIPALAVCAERS
jgi:cyclopropane fatty-acyl-phospholipid synthase-like methyltransferase